MPSLLEEGHEVAVARIVALPEGRISHRPEGHTGKRGVVASFCEHVMLHSTAERKRVRDPIPKESWTAPRASTSLSGRSHALEGKTQCHKVRCVKVAHRAVVCDYRYRMLSRVPGLPPYALGLAIMEVLVLFLVLLGTMRHYSDSLH